ncbi:MAG TPA: cysteine--tRNA ligase [Clostridia bacterium]|nr:cysteine--tRNA ligase [Clostridia bacterium]
MQVYNTLTGGKEEFRPREPGKVSMYVCGPTTYNYIHLGNARASVVFDTVRRYLKYKGYEVLYVQNFTDVDDKIINKANEENSDALQLGQRYIEEYFKDADALNILRADEHPKVSGHIDDIIGMVKSLERNGYAYQVGETVYYDVGKFEEYGKLSGRSLDEMQAGARVEVDANKRSPMDFVLWKASKPGEPAWESPWGKGRPGWHIECSAMSLTYLGADFDIHGGGQDLIFPHHENEIAQSEAATGKRFVKYWLHNGFITVNKEKMSKSLGNFFLVRDILDKFPPEVVRFFLVSTHYRSPLDFDDGKLDESSRALDRVKNSMALLGEILALPVGKDDGPAAKSEFSKRLDEIRSGFEQAMDDDFNTALAVGHLFDLARITNSYLRGFDGALTEGEVSALKEAKRLFADFNRVLGIFKEDDMGNPVLGDGTPYVKGLEEELIEFIVSLRRQARERKDWETADGIRDGLKKMGITLEDTPHGARWKMRDQ